MTEQHFVIALVQGTAEDLNRDFVKCPGMTAIEVTEDTYDDGRGTLGIYYILLLQKNRL